MHVSSANAVQDDVLQVQALTLMFQRLGNTQLQLFIMPVVMVLAFWGHVSTQVLLAWGLAVTLIYSSRIVLGRRYNRLQPEGAEALRYGHYYTLSSTFSGLAWGAGGMLFFLPDSASHQVLMYTAIMGLASGSVIVTAYWLPGFYAFAIPAMGMVILRLAWEGTIEYAGLALLLLMYLSILINVARAQKQVAFDNLRLRYENLDLIAQLTRQKQLAEQANIAKSRFLAAASHDLRQPLHALSLFVATLDSKLRQLEVRPLVVSIGQSVAALEGLFNALLDISRLDAGIVQPHITGVRLQALFQRLAEQYAVLAQQQDLAWHMDCEDVAARTDPVLLETLLHNLISNALRYTRQGQVSLSCRIERNAAGQEIVLIVVADTGIGIATENQAAVFDEFVQLHNPERDRNKGLGLGLAIVRRLVTLLDHELTLHSAPGQGTRFTLQLPLATIVGQVPEAAQPVLATHGNGLRIVVIDDEAVVLRAITALLQEWGYEVTLAESAAQALAQLQQPPQVIIADYRLREHQTGIEAIAAIQQRWGNDIPALIITGDTAAEQLRELGDTGISVLHKPVQPARLRSFLRQAAQPQRAG